MLPSKKWRKIFWIVTCLSVTCAAIGCSTPVTKGFPILAGLFQHQQKSLSLLDELKPDLNLDRQDLMAGLLIAAGLFVSFSAYQGCSELFVTVPDITRLPLKEAEEQLLVAGLKLGTVFEAHSGSIPAGAIISQDPEAGKRIFSGKKVNVLLSSGPQLEIVPDVTGESREKAESTLAGSGFTVGDITHAYSASVPEGMVISQDPAGGASALPGSPVNLVLSLGEEYLTVPEVTGKALAAAQTEITGAGMTVGAITLRYSDTVLKDIVISQSPTAGTLVTRNTAIDLVVSEGPQPVSVPDLVGQTETNALVLISGSGFIPGQVSREWSDSIPSGIVISQSPEAGLMRAPGTSISVVVSDGPEPSEVPDVTGKNQEEAAAIIAAAGFSLGRVVQGFSETVPAGLVISQNPGPGVMAPPGTSINLVLSQGQEPVAVPDIVGDPELDALAVITGTGFIPGEITREWSDTVSAGMVISQNPAGGTVMPPGTPVNFVVSRGPEPVTVPGVTGKSQAEAQAAITGAGLTVGMITLRYSDSVPEGFVISQEPGAGSLVLPGTAVSLFVSRGPQPIPVPGIVGKTQAEAQRILTDAGFSLGSITQEWSASVPSGTVISQDPGSGVLALPGSPVNFVVSKGPQPVTVPAVTGKSRQEAVALITGAGLAVGSVTQEYSADVAEDIVLRQQPISGLQVLPGSSVDLVVATKRIHTCEYYPIAVGNKWETEGDGGYIIEVSEKLLINGFECWKMSGVDYTTPPKAYTAYAVYVNGWLYLYDVFSDLYKLPQVASSATRLYPEYITPGVPFYFKYSGINFEVMPEKGRFSSFVPDTSPCPYGDVEETIALKLGNTVMIVLGRNLGALWQIQDPSFTTSIMIVGGCGIHP